MWLQVTTSGLVQLVSSVGDRGTRAMTLTCSGSKGLGPEGAQQLARLLREAQLSLLTSLDLRQMTPTPHDYQAIIPLIVFYCLV